MHPKIRKDKDQTLSQESSPFGLSSSIIRYFIDHMAQRLNCSVSIFQALIQYMATVNRLGFNIFSQALGGTQDFSVCCLSVEVQGFNIKQQNCPIK